jgi:hypothetical protein
MYGFKRFGNAAITISACFISSRVRAFAALSSCLIFDQHCSTGDISGEYGASYITRAPLVAITSSSSTSAHTFACRRYQNLTIWSQKGHD